MPRKWGAVSLSLSLLALASCTTVPSSQKNTSRTFTTVVVDAGHGGKDSGAYRRYGPPEKMATLDVATQLAHKLRESELQTVLTRADDTFIPLDTRVAIENRTRNSIFVSIHFNDSRRSGVKGFETYYHSGVAADLAQRIERNLSTIPGSVNRGVHTANFRVLRKAVYPAVLVECGYLSNRSDGREARTGAYRALLADKIAEAIVEARFGPGVYRAPAATATEQNTNAAQLNNPTPPGEGPPTSEQPRTEPPDRPVPTLHQRR